MDVKVENAKKGREKEEGGQKTDARGGEKIKKEGRKEGKKEKRL